MVDDLFGIVGTVIAGAYRVEAVVAEGGFSVVYRAQHQGFNAPVALKCMKLPEKLSLDRQQSFLQQFRAEGELLFELSASIPTVVRPLHIDALTVADGTFVPYMVLEWLAGETLEERLDRRGAESRSSFPIKKLVRLLAPVADALARAHNFRGRAGSVSIVHCDIKPENIFIAEVGGDEVVKILDFGVSKAQSVANQVAGQANAEGRGATWFTPAFAAPEQWKPDTFGEVGPWTDVWGLALTMVEALAGAPVFEGEPHEIRARALDVERRPTPKSMGVVVDAAVERVFVRALAVDPRDRPRDVGVFWDELSAALGMRDTRPRDARREAGLVPREEVIEAVLPPAARLVSKPSPPRPAAPASPPLKRAPTRPTLGMDDPFLDDEPLDSGLEGAVGLEAPLPSTPPPAQPAGPMLVEPPNLFELDPSVGGEAPLPSVPPGSQFGSEASLPSIPAPAPVDLELGAPLEIIQGPRAADRPIDLARTAPSAFGYEAPLPMAKPAVGPGKIDVEDAGPRGARPRHAHSQQPAAPEPRRSLPWFRVGLGLVIGAIAIGLVGRLYHGSTGQALALGPLSSTVIAGVLLVAGLGLIVFHLLPKDG